MTILLKKCMMKSCYDAEQGDGFDGQKCKGALVRMRNEAMHKGIVCLVTRLLMVALPFAIVGCRENYESPEAFIKHWVIDREAKRYCSDERMKELHFKGIEVSDAHLSAKGGETAVYATLRFVPDSDKTVYAFRDNFPQFIPNSNNNPKDFGMQIISQEELKKWVTADLKMPRIKMDDGTFAPADMDGKIKYIHGWGAIGSLMVVNEESITANLRKLLAETKSLQDPNAKKANSGAMIIMRLASYASSGELDYIKDKQVLEELGEACTGILVLTANEKIRNQLVHNLGEKAINAFAVLSETLRTRGATVNGPKDLEGLVTSAQKGRELFVALVAAGTEREALGLDHIWPKSAKNLSNDKNDVSGIMFADAKQYFDVLFDLPSRRKPYVVLDESAVYANNQVLWSVALDVGDDISELSPILVSANFDCSKLPSRWSDGNMDVDKVIPIGSCPIIGNKGVVVITKGGKVISLPANKVTLRNIYGKGSFTLPKQYLTPNGVVKVGE